jgi:hypothetical protein
MADATHGVGKVLFESQDDIGPAQRVDFPSGGDFFGEQPGGLRWICRRVVGCGGRIRIEWWFGIPGA